MSNRIKPRRNNFLPCRTTWKHNGYAVCVFFATQARTKGSVMTENTVRASITAEATDYILDHFGNISMKEPSEHRFQKLLLEFETSKRMFLNNNEVLAVKCNLRWVWDDIVPIWLCPPTDIRVEMDNYSSGWKNKETEESKDD